MAFISQSQNESQCIAILIKVLAELGYMLICQIKKTEFWKFSFRDEQKAQQEF